MSTVFLIDEYNYVSMNIQKIKIEMNLNCNWAGY